MFHFPAWINFEDLFACPCCCGNLQVNSTQSEITCITCKRKYHIYNGIPYLLDEDSLNEFERGESEFHTRVATQADSAHGQDTLRVKFLHNSFLEPILNLPKESIILDVACGSGYDLIKLAENGYYVIGLDISPGMLMVIKNKAEEKGLTDRFFLCRANSSKLPLQNKRVKSAYICAALHHMQDPITVLQEMVRVVNNNGYVIIGSEPNRWIYKFRYFKHSKIGRALLRIFRDDYTIGDQPPGDRDTQGWSFQDWRKVISRIDVSLISVKPIWYLNGIASLFGMHNLPHWIESLLIYIDNCISRIVVIRNYSVKWNVITRKNN